MRHWILAAVVLAVAGQAEAQNAVKPGEEKKTDNALNANIAKADIVLVGKVTQVGLSAASSFDVGIIEVREVLKGDEKTKTVHFRFASRGDEAAAQYGKKGVEGVWVLDKAGGYMDSRGVLQYLPLTEVDAVKKMIPKK